MNRIIANSIIKTSFNFSVWLIAKCSNMQQMEKKGNELRELPEGTLGREIANCLDSRNLRLVPGFESHDLKHVVLGYKMIPEGEIRMQAFMLGNGNYSLPCFIILLFGMVLLPGLWPVLYRDFLIGRSTLPISNWTIDEFAKTNIEELRKIIGDKAVKKRTVNMQAITRFAAFAVMASGISGMLFCLPFLFSSNMTDLVGAGFPFIGGAILVVGGLIALSNLSRVQQYDPAKQAVS